MLLQVLKRTYFRETLWGRFGTVGTLEYIGLTLATKETGRASNEGLMWLRGQAYSVRVIRTRVQFPFRRLMVLRAFLLFFRSCGRARLALFLVVDHALD